MPEFAQSDGLDLEQDLNEAYLAKLCSLGTRCRYKPRQSIYHQGDEARHVYVLRAGTVKATQTDKSGHEALLKIHGPGSLLGLSALRPRAIRDANGIALEPAETVAFTREAFFDYMRADGELGVLLVRVLLKRQQALHARVAEVASHRVDQRLARVLLQLNAESLTRGPGSIPVSMSITHEDLATLVLSRRQYVTAILGSFAARGFIAARRRRIQVLDPAGLAAVADGERRTSPRT